MNPTIPSDLNSPSPEVTELVPAKSSAVKAGWVCLVLGFLTFWIFGFGFIFFIATFVLAIVAMSTNKVGQGIALLVSSVASAVICAVASIFLLSGAFKSALLKERAERATATEHQRVITEETTLQDLLGPEKRSLRVNVNTAKTEELESLPNIGPSKAEVIITNRPYQSVDELAKLRGISQRILDEMRPFIKTDGTTEKIQPAK